MYMRNHNKLDKPYNLQKGACLIEYIQIIVLLLVVTVVHSMDVYYSVSFL